MKRLLLLFSIVFFGNHIYAQLQDRIWVFGRPIAGSTNATLYFGDLSNPSVNLPNGQPNSITVNNGGEQWAVVTNPGTGDLIFYTDGKNVFDNQNNLVSLIDLGANISSSQPVAISPLPRSDTKSAYRQYYIFSNSTGADISSFKIGTVKYRIYDAINQTFGPSQNLPGIYGTSLVTEGMKILPCGNDPDVLWLIVSLFPVPGLEKKYVVYKIDKNAVNYHGDFDIGPQKLPLPGSGSSPIEYIASSHSKTTPGITNVGFALQYPSLVFTCMFDNINGGFLTNTVKLCYTGYTSPIPSVYNLEFSPNGDFIYYSVYKTAGDLNELYQVDLRNTFLSPTLVHTFSETYAGGLKLGPDSLIYHISDNGYYSNGLHIGRILQPNQRYIPGVTIFNQFYEENFKTYNNVFGFGLCEFLVLPVPQLGISDQTAGSGMSKVLLFPNPAKDFVTIENPSPIYTSYEISINNIKGQTMLRKKIHFTTTYSLNVNGLNNGTYFLTLQNEEEDFIGKITIQK